MYDIIIIGMGISGITAGIYAKRGNKNILIIESKMPGGVLNNIDTISNYPGLANVKGMDLAQDLFNQTQILEIPFKFETVTKIIDNKKTKIVKTSHNEYETKNVIIATGRRPLSLGLDNESDLLGKGLSTCAVCDGAFYKDKIVAVVGSGDSALQESLYLSNIVKKIYLIVRKDYLRANLDLQEKIKNKNNIEVLYKTEIKKINLEDGKIKNLELNTSNLLEVDGVFLYIGYTPNTEFLKDLKILDKQGYVKVNDKFETKIKGIYAVGDILNKEIYQLVTGASEGAQAAMNIINKENKG